MLTIEDIEERIKKQTEMFMDLIKDEKYQVSEYMEADIIEHQINQMKELMEDTIEILRKKRHDYGLSFDDSVKKHGGVAYEIALDWKLNRVHSFLMKGELKNESLEDALRDIIGYTLLYWRILKFDS